MSKNCDLCPVAKRCRASQAYSMHHLMNTEEMIEDKSAGGTGKNGLLEYVGEYGDLGELKQRFTDEWTAAVDDEVELTRNCPGASWLTRRQQRLGKFTCESGYLKEPV